MQEEVEKHSALPNFATPMPGTLREVLDNDIIPRDRITLNWLGMTKGESGGLSMMPKTRMEVAQDYTVLKYGPHKLREKIKVPR